MFITFEGTDGAGKSTLIRHLARSLRRQGHALQITREPGGTALGNQIRRLLLQKDMNSWTELFLYEAARCEHLAKTIRPALAQKKIILCDRYADSSLAYQAQARGLPW